MRYLVVSLIAILFVGCTTVTPPKTEFRINPTISVVHLTSKECKTSSLKIAQAFSSSELMSQDMNYGLGDFKQYVYSKSKWSVAPNKVITAKYLELLRETKLFNSVQVSKSRSNSDYILEINIEDFMQYFNEDSSKSYVVVTISLSLIETKANVTYATKTFSTKIDVDSLDAKGGVESLNNALGNILSRSSEWLGEVCR